jgi:hypothetical protein
LSWNDDVIEFKSSLELFEKNDRVLDRVFDNPFFDLDDLLEVILLPDMVRINWLPWSSDFLLNFLKENICGWLILL